MIFLHFYYYCTIIKFFGGGFSFDLEFGFWSLGGFFGWLFVCFFHGGED